MIVFWIALVAFLVVGTIGICAFFNWISTGDPDRFPSKSSR